MDNVRDMDIELKNAIYIFFKRDYKISGYAEDITDELEEFLKKEGFDLGCIRQYKKEI